MAIGTGTAILAGTIGGGLLAGGAAKSAAKTQAAAADRAAELQREMFERQVELQEPWRQAGINALNRMQSGDIMGTMDPSYQFRLKEGLKSLDRQASARGGLISGSALKAAQRYGQDFASTEFGNAYNRLAGLAGVGQTATNTLGTAGQNYATNAGEAMGASAQARASGYMGAANSIGGAFNQYLNYNQNQQQNALLRQVLDRNIGYSGQGPMGYAP